MSNTQTKGEYQGICNRSACDTKQPAIYYNHSTELYYCKACAMLLNYHNQADAIRLFGHSLCTLGENKLI